MWKEINPRLPMRDKASTRNYYINKLGFKEIGDYKDFLMVKKDSIEIHFFAFYELNPLENYGGIYIRTNNIDQIYQELIDNGVEIHPNGKLEIKPWNQKEFAILDPDNNLLTFGQSMV